MAAGEPLAVVMSLGEWEKIKNILDRASDLTPTARKLRIAIDDAFNARIDAKIAHLNAIGQGE